MTVRKKKTAKKASKKSASGLTPRQIRRRKLNTIEGYYPNPISARLKRRRKLNTIEGYYPNPNPKPKKRRASPGAKVPIGKVLGIMYERDGTKYLHKFTSHPPSLATNMHGNRIFVEGGKFQWTPLGVK